MKKSEMKMLALKKTFQDVLKDFGIYIVLGGILTVMYIVKNYGPVIEVSKEIIAIGTMSVLVIGSLAVAIFYLKGEYEDNLSELMEKEDLK